MEFSADLLSTLRDKTRKTMGVTASERLEVERATQRSQEDGRSRRATGRTAQLNLRFRPEMKAQIQHAADVRGLLLIEVIEEAFELYMAKQSEPQP